MSVSIIIPHFNRSILLRETINSIKEQTYLNWEIIVVDDGSVDSEYQSILALQSSNIFIFKRTNPKKGPSACRNQAVKTAKGKYLLFLDSDDLLAPYCLEQRLEAMELDNSVNMGIFLMKYFRKFDSDDESVFNLDIPRDKWIGYFLQNKNPWNVTCPIWKKSFFERVGGFDDELLYMEDPDLHLRAITNPHANIKTFYDKPVDSYYRIGYNDETKTEFWYNSIFYRIEFFKKLTDSNSSLLRSHATDIKIGVYNMVRVFLYHRMYEFEDLFYSLIKWMKKSQIFNFYEIARIKYLTEAGNSRLNFLKMLRFRGLCYRLLPIK